jgi:hypothetical protein
MELHYQAALPENVAIIVRSVLTFPPATLALADVVIE